MGTRDPPVALKKDEPVMQPFAVGDLIKRGNWSGKEGAEMKNLNPEKKEPFEAMAGRDALRFLHTELASLENKIREQTVYVAEAYPGGRLPPGETDLMEVFEEERALIMELVGDCQKKPLTKAFYQRMDEERRRVLELSAEELRDTARARDLRQARRAEAMLADILNRWLDWHKASSLPAA